MILSKSRSACNTKISGGTTKAIAKKTPARTKTAFLCKETKNNIVFQRIKV